MTRNSTDVIARAEELAQTGLYPDWLSVEQALRSDGFSEARSMLDSEHIRERLDGICQVAIAEPEASRRAAFSDWLASRVGELSDDELRRGKAHISVRSDTIYISGYGYDAQVFRQ